MVYKSVTNTQVDSGSKPGMTLGREFCAVFSISVSDNWTTC